MTHILSLPVVPTDELLVNGTMKESEAQVKIARLATALARTLYQQLAGQPYTGAVAASAHLVRWLHYNTWILFNL